MKTELQYGNELCQICGEFILDDNCTGNNEDGFIHYSCLDDYNEDCLEGE